MKKILVTGGAGFIGSHVLEALQSHKDWNVTVLDNLSSGSRSHLTPHVSFIEMDVRDKALRSFMKENKFDAVIHLAAQTMVPYSMAHPEEDADINLMGLLNLLEACRETGVKQFLFSSSAAVYGDNSHLPIHETEPLAPTSFYGLSKATAESYIRLYCSFYGMDGVILRFANVYGERQGENGEGGVISIFARRLAKGQNLMIYGDGNQTRDFIYVGDIADVLVRALGYKGVVTWNVSTNTQVSLNKLIEVFHTVTGREISVSYGPAREGDIYDSMLCNEALSRELGKKDFTSLETGLRKTMQDLLKN
jgi:UDP-glucose 4-epimerase